VIDGQAFAALATVRSTNMDRGAFQDNLKFVMPCITKTKVREHFVMACITIRNETPAQGTLMGRIYSAINKLRVPVEAGRPSKGE
jgi:hypothetical protein